MSTVSKPFSSISLQEAADLIAAAGDKVTYVMQGHIGTGKSSMLNTIGEKMGIPPERRFYYDCTTKQAGDVSVPKFRNENGRDILSFIPNEELGFSGTEPVLVMVDELGKSDKGVLKSMLRFLHEHQVGMHKLPLGSAVFATTNLGAEGVGDLIPPHGRNRVCVVKVRKPTAQEWVDNFAIGAGLSPIVITAALEYPMMFQSFEDVNNPNDNQYIYHPKQPLPAFVTPRSLHKASDMLVATESLPDGVRTHALMGLVGEAAALDIMTLARLDETLPRWDDIVNKPEDTKVPERGVAQVLLANKAIMNVEPETMGAWMTYCQRMPKEVQALFGRGVMSGEKMSWVIKVGAFTTWARDTLHLL
jgi:hypothetical protein